MYTYHINDKLSRTFADECLKTSYQGGLESIKARLRKAAKSKNSGLAVW